MGRMYSASFSAVAVTVVQDLFELNAPSDAAVRVHEIRISQVTKTTTELLRLIVQRATASGSGGSTFTPSPLAVGDPAFGGTVEINNTTQGTTLTVLMNTNWNVVNGEWVWLPTPECRIDLSPSGRLLVSLQTAPAAEMTMSGTIVFEEIGG